jgi:beta-galactosidase/beta-glucuronidase
MLTTILLASHAVAEDWKPAPGHLMTRWAKDVTPDRVLPEYPRPQMVRKDWQNLNGLWDYAITSLDAAQPAQFGGKILVPFCIESALSGVKQPLTAEQRLWYRRTFTAPDLAGGKRLLLHFGAVDWDTAVLVNGKQVGQHKGGFDAFTLDITDAVKAGDNELVVSVFDSSKGTQARGKQSFPRFADPKGITYTPCSGIWQTVWLEAVPAEYIESLKIVPDLDGGAVEVTANVAGAASKVVVQVTVLDAGKVVAQGRGIQNEKIRLAIPNAKPWSPDEPFLYDLKVTYFDDEVQSYFGMRKIAVVKDDKGVARIMLNGKSVFQVGFLDQGYWPDGIYTAPTDEALRYDIEMTKKLGMNVARKHVKVEPDRWYYWCDKLGLLVWQDMPSAGPRDGAVGKGAGRNKQTGEMVDGKPVSPEAAAQFEAELKAMVEGRWNHPSIVMWVVFNEGWGQYDTPRLTKWVKGLDPSRLVNNASGGHDIPAGDIMDAHRYPGPGAPNPTDGRAGVLGEFGGLGLPIMGHTWVQSTWGYRGMADQAELTSRYAALLQSAYQLKDTAGLNAVIYTQTTDVETECNGLLTYDREIVKPDLQKIADANRGKFPPAPKQP